MATDTSYHGDLEADAEAVIGACDGDARAAVRVLLVVNAYLETEIERLTTAVSPGYVRGQISDNFRGKPRAGLALVNDIGES